MSFSLITTPTSSIHKVWSRFAKSKTVRDQFVAGYVKRAIPAQIRALMKKRGLTQQKLAEQSGLTQGVISRAADLNYGDLSLNTIIKIGSGFDCAFVGKYVPYSEFLKETDEGVITDIPSFEKENEELQREEQRKAEAVDLGAGAQESGQNLRGIEKGFGSKGTLDALKREKTDAA